MTSFLEQTTRVYEMLRHSAPSLHPIARGMARMSVRAYAKLQSFQFPPDEPYNYRYLTDMHESGTTVAVKRVLRPGMIAVDVGAHVGYYTRLFAKLVGKHGKVYAFEPHPKTFAILERNTNIFPNVTRFNMAVLDRKETIVLYESRSSQTNSIWMANTRGDPVGSIVVKAVSLDELLGGVLPDLVKVDVEGSELEVLRGMHGLLSRSANLTLIVEWNPSCLFGRGADPGLLIRTIAGLEFNISAIDEKTGKVEPVNIQSGVEPLLQQRVKYINLLCAKTKR